VIVLFEWSTGRSREMFLAEMGEPVDMLTGTDPLSRFQDAIERRSRGTPIAYITGTREFRGFSFHVDPGILVPRPETETLVEETLVRLSAVIQPPRYHDCCTGSGCVAIAVVYEWLDRGFTIEPGFSDIEEEALHCARRNAAAILGDRVRWDSWHGSWLDGLTRTVDVITANPPYLSDEETDSVLARGWGEPRRALAAGPDGLSAYRALVPQALYHLRPGGYLLLECGSGQARQVERLCREAGYGETTITRDLGQRDRVVAARRHPQETTAD
jgi:release factor glutamine methyltransferase